MIRSRQHLLTGALVLSLLAAGCASGSSPASEAPGNRPAAEAAAPGASTPEARVMGEAAVTAETTQVCSVPARFEGLELERLPVQEKLIALTFDAGADADAVRPVLDTLAARDVRATFFLTGSFVRAFPMKSQRIARRHLVGNHTMGHLDLTTLTDLRVTRQVRRAEAAILEVTGEDPRRFIRFPFGARNAHTTDVVNNLCYVPFRWTVDTLGWMGTSGGMTTSTVVGRVLDAARPGAIVLMHVGSNPEDGSMLDAEALPIVIRRLRLRGFTFVRLSRVLDARP